MSTAVDKNETSRFLGEGVSFKAKLIGILEVSEARGDRMCQEALSDLKTAIRAAGEHKQRITINVAIDGLRLRDEKTGDSLYHHPVHKISFIAQDMTDSRAFGYIFGSPDTGHRFFGIKTDKAASQVVIAMRDLFQVVFALKKKEVELAKQHLDKSRYGSSPLFSETNLPSSKVSSATTDSSKITGSDNKANATNNERSTPAVADLVDLELELNSLQQGLHQMERITPSDPFGSKDDPFGDSFTPFPKPILPPPPSSGKERSSRTSESSSLFSPKTPQTGGSVDISGIDSSSLLYTPKDLNLSHDFSLSHDEPSSGDWFTPPASNCFFEDQPLAAGQTKTNNQDQHEKKKQEILSHFDVFTDLDPLDPFGEDPFVKSDPFAETDFTKQDPFDSELGAFNQEQQNKSTEHTDQFKFSAKSLSRSPKGNSLLEKQMSLASVSPRSNAAAGLAKQNTFDVQFDQVEDKKFGKLNQLHENPSLDLSSESECAPEPPPRPTSNITQIKPPPLPPKKQAGELCVKPPPRPPHSDFDLRYDYIETYETAPNSLEFVGTGIEKSPPLPAPARKIKCENDFSRTRNKLGTNVEEEDYLTPVSLPKANKGPILLPPPQKSNRKSNISPNNLAQVTVSSYLENKPNIVTSTPTGGEKNLLADGLDITLSQLTLSGLNELATKLDIPATQLSNMTLAQLTTYLSSFIKNKANDCTTTDSDNIKNQANSNNVTFPADFANFNNFNVKTGETFDRYAVFRELLEEEIKHSRFSGESENENRHHNEEELTNNMQPANEKTIHNNGANTTPVIDKYAALREIVETENGRGKSIDEENNLDENTDENTGSGERNDLSEKHLHEKTVEVENEANIINTEKFSENKDNNKIIEYNVSLDMKKDIIVTTPVNSPVEKIVKSPVPEVITEIINNSTTRLTSGSLSDVVSGSSPEIDNTGSNSEVVKKTNDATGESWAIFDQLNSVQESSKEKQNVQSEEGVSPWSSDSKEFGNDGSPPDWEPRINSGSGGERRWNRRRRGDPDGGGWWDTSAEPEVQYYPANSANRRSTDSYDDEYYECYDRPRRRRQAGGGYSTSAVQIPTGTGGHSSSSRDVSPWEEEPTNRRRDYRDGRQTWSSKHGAGGRQHSFERHKDKRYNDSWDEEDDYEYEEEHCNRFYWHGGERHPDGSVDHHRWSEDWNEESRKHPTRRRRDVESRDRWCCPDWNQVDAEKPSGGRYSGRWSDIPPSSKRRDRERYYSRDSQESPWEDEYSNDPEEGSGGGGGGGLTPHYSTTRRPWKRPSSASEMDRKTGEIKSRQGPYHLGTGGSDGERDRRYKSGRRSKSRESQFSDIPHNRHKPDPGLTIRARPKHHHQKSGHFESDYVTDIMPPKKGGDSGKMLNLQDHSGKKSVIGNRKKKESPKSEEFVRQPLPPTTRQSQSLFENDFVTTETESPSSAAGMGKRFTFENDFETSEADSPIIKSSRGIKSPYAREQPASKFMPSRSSQSKQRSLFEDDFSPTEKSDTQDSPAVPSIKEEDIQRSAGSVNEEEQDSFSSLRTGGNGLRKKMHSKHRMSMNTDSLKKSESVNIFARENDPFDDEFFSGKDIGEPTTVEICNNGANGNKVSPRLRELKWTEQFEDFDTLDGK
ncbi:Phosphotyrosine interaction domain (PTB/PID) [Popillia japonica]|uniref:Phosphotyrosine interaction domain (PTB/PID) n=1 Tax=Popillia japonica TaxID=7064 RepID=A0AAW1NM57_POPJA